METHQKRTGRIGRPSAAQADLRKRTIGIRVNAAELETLQTKAGRAGLPLGQWLRRAALSRSVPRPLVPELNRAAYAELAKLAGNLNQLTRAVQTGNAQVSFPLLKATYDAVKALRLELLGAARDSQND